MSYNDLGAVSAYAIAVEHGYVGTEAEWLESIKGVSIDKTLTDSNKAAPADKVGELNEDIAELHNTTETPVASGKVWTSSADGAGWADPQGGGGGTATDVRINGTSITQDGVADIPVALPNKAYMSGVPSLGIFETYTGLTVDSRGRVSVKKATSADISSRKSMDGSNGGLLDCAGLVTAVNSVVCSTAESESLTSTEQANARKRLGFGGEWALLDTKTLTEDENGIVKIFANPLKSLAISIQFIGTYTNNQWIQAIAQMDKNTITLNGNNSTEINVFRAISYANNAIAFVSLISDNGIISAKISDSSTNRGYINHPAIALEAIEHWFANDARITQVTLKQQTTFRAGTVIRYFGLI